MTNPKKIQNDLLAFFGGYFHQDWKMEAETADMVIAKYKEDVGDEKSAIIAKKIQNELIHSNLSNDDLSNKLYQNFGCHYYAGDNPDSVRVWLQNVVNQLLTSEKKL